MLEREIQRAVRGALREDLGPDWEDITTSAVVPGEAVGEARILSKSPGIIAGIPVASRVFKELDDEVQVVFSLEDGAKVEQGDEVMKLRGHARALLSGERTALNFLSRLSGIATLTNRFSRKVAGLGVTVLETRKTTPGLRILEKYAVSVGGGQNHRIGLYDMVLLKENHFAMSVEGTGMEAYKRTVARAVRLARGKGPVAAEARTMEEAVAALQGGADIILLDNMTPGELANTIAEAKKTMRESGKEAVFEASGGVTLENILEIASTGVDRISIGALTHSALPLDLTMLLSRFDGPYGREDK